MALYDELTNLYDQDLHNIDQDAPNMKVFNFLNRNKESIENIEKEYLDCIKEVDKRTKLKLSQEQAKVLENVFNWALNLLEEETKKNYIIFQNVDGVFEKFDFEKESKKIEELFDFFRESIEIEKESKTHKN